MTAAGQTIRGQGDSWAERTFTGDRRVSYIGLSPSCRLLTTKSFDPASLWRSDPMAKARQFLGVTPIRWLEYLIAILIGNAIYYLSLAPHLPQALRHQGFEIDGGVIVDFVVCVAVYWLIRLGIHLNEEFLSKIRGR
jgi:hypothetical protein